ncbi:MAG: hypothetical protein ACLQVJ_30060 [Syntrophobacteraceae bacterium]
MNRVRAKFKVDSIRREHASRVAGKDPKTGYPIYEPIEVRTIVMSPVYGNADPDHENTKFWEASPSGKLELGCANLAAAEVFELGQEYYIDFTKAE